MIDNERRAEAAWSGRRADNQSVGLASPLHRLRPDLERVGNLFMRAKAVLLFYHVHAPTGHGRALVLGLLIEYG